MQFFLQVVPILNLQYDDCIEIYTTSSKALSYRLDITEVLRQRESLAYCRYEHLGSKQRCTKRTYSSLYFQDI